MCVRVCARGPMCTQGNTEKGVGFVERGIIRSIDEQNIFPSSFDRYYVLEFFDILSSIEIGMHGGMGGITLLTLERDYFACMVWFYRTFACKFIISNSKVI